MGLIPFWSLLYRIFIRAADSFTLHQLPGLSRGKSTWAGVARARLAPLSPPGRMSWWFNDIICMLGGKAVPHISSQVEGEGEIKVSVRVVQQRLCPSSAQPPYSPDGRPSPLGAHGTWRWWLHRCSQWHQIPTTGSQSGGSWKGPLGVIWCKSGYLHQWKYYFVLFHSLWTVWGTLRPSCLALLDSWEKWAMKSINLFLLHFCKVLPHTLWSDGLASYPAKFHWRWGSSGGKAVIQESWQQSCAWGANTKCERDWPALCDGIFHPPPTVLRAHSQPSLTWDIELKTCNINQTQGRRE